MFLGGCGETVDAHRHPSSIENQRSRSNELWNKSWFIVMLNSKCAPEMSFNGMPTSGDEPHAYVQYKKGDKEIVPVSFIQKFPLKWRQKKAEGGGWDPNYLYKVFWSPDENDTPPKMLKYVAEIPVRENGSDTRPGYYRASVIDVKGEDFFLSPSLLLCLAPHVLMFFFF